MADDLRGPGNTGGRFVRAVPEGDPGTAPALRLDDAGLDGRRVGLLKIDVEGATGLVLAGGRGVLERDRPLVVWEDKPKFARRFPGAPDPREVLQSLGYEEVERVGSDRIWRHCDGRG